MVVPQILTSTSDNSRQTCRKTWRPIRHHLQSIATLPCYRHAASLGLAERKVSCGASFITHSFTGRPNFPIGKLPMGQLGIAPLDMALV